MKTIINFSRDHLLQLIGLVDYPDDDDEDDETVSGNSPAKRLRLGSPSY